MRSRCLYPSSPGWANYGGRGISVCERWLDFANFLADMGERPLKAMSIERMDVNGDYEPGNCVWATREVQSANRRDTVWVDWQGGRRKLIEIARAAGQDIGTVRGRLRMGWTLDRALSQPVHVAEPKSVRRPGRPPSLRGPAMRLLTAGHSPREVARQTGAALSTVYLAAQLLEMGHKPPE